MNANHRPVRILALKDRAQAPSRRDDVCPRLATTPATSLIGIINGPILFDFLQGREAGPSSTRERSTLPASTACWTKRCSPRVEQKRPNRHGPFRAFCSTLVPPGRFAQALGGAIPAGRLGQIHHQHRSINAGQGSSTGQGRVAVSVRPRGERRRRRKKCRAATSEVVRGQRPIRHDAARADGAGWFRGPFKPGPDGSNQPRQDGGGTRPSGRSTISKAPGRR